MSSTAQQHAGAFTPSLSADQQRALATSLVTFLRQYRHFTDSYIIEFFCEDHWQKLPSRWQRVLQDLTYPQVADLLLDPAPEPRSYPSVWPLSLLAFRATAHALSFPRGAAWTQDLGRGQGRGQGSGPAPDAKPQEFQGNPSQSALLKHIFRKHVKPKKQHEIQRLGRVVKQLCDQTQCEQVVDVGSGQGHLTRFLSFGLGLSVTAVEADGALVSMATKFDRELETTLEKERQKQQKLHPEAVAASHPRPRHVAGWVNPKASWEDFLQLLSSAESRSDPATERLHGPSHDHAPSRHSPSQQAELPVCVAELPVCGAKPPPHGAELPVCGAELPVCGAKPPPHRVELPVCGAELPVCGAELPVCGAELPVCGAELPVRGAELPVCGAELPVRGAELPVCGAKPPPHGAELPVCGAELPVCGAKPPPHRVELPVCGAELPVCGAELPVSRAELPVCGAERPVCGAELPVCGAGLVLTGLHACGDLSATLLRLLVRCPQVRALTSVACCYMKLSTRESPAPPGAPAPPLPLPGDPPPFGFPMSSWVGGLPGHRLSYKAREGACHAAEEYARRLRGRSALLRAHCYRAMLETFIRERRPQLRRAGIQTGNKSHLLTFEEYARLGLARAGLPPDTPLAPARVAAMLAEQGRVVVFFSLALMMAPALETLLLLDRILFLQENGVDSRLVALFNPNFSPRNFVLVARKQQNPN